MTSKMVSWLVIAPQNWYNANLVYFGDPQSVINISLCGIWESFFNSDQSQMSGTARMVSNPSTGKTT